MQLCDCKKKKKKAHVFNQALGERREASPITGLVTLVTVPQSPDLLSHTVLKLI